MSLFRGGSMKNKVRKILLSCLTLVCALSFFVACDNSQEATPKVYATISTPEYLVVKTGDEVSLGAVVALTEDGKECAVSITITDAQSQQIALKGKSFTPAISGKYKVMVNGGKNVLADSVEFFVYATTNGSAYTITPPSQSEIPETVEWGEECLLPIVKAVHIVDGEEVADIVVKDKDGKDAVVNGDRFVPQTLGKHTITYTYGGAEWSVETDCIDTKAPVVFLSSGGLDKPSYNQDFLLPYLGIVDAQENPEKRVVKVYSEDTDREIAYVPSPAYEGDGKVAVSVGRMKIDASKYFRYEIYVEDMNELGATYTFIINRSAHSDIDTFGLSFEGNTVKWQDRRTLENKYNGYHQVKGYQVSIDGGKTYGDVIGADINEYEIDSTEFCKIVVKELSDNDRESAVSEVFNYDGSLGVGQLASFNNVAYEQIFSRGSFCLDNSATGKGFTWNYDNALNIKYNENGYGEVTDGVVMLQNQNPVAVKITFPKRIDEIKADSLLVMHFYSNSNNVPGDNTYIIPYGKISFNYKTISDYGYQKGKWQTLSIPMSDIEGTVGEIIQGVEISFRGLFVLDYIDIVSPSSVGDELAAELTGDQIANFDNNRYSYLVSKGENFYFNSLHHVNYEILTDGYDGVESGVLKIDKKDLADAALCVKFPETFTAKAMSYFKITLMTTATKSYVEVGGYDWGERQGDTIQSTNKIGYSLSKGGFTANGWETVYVPVCEALEIQAGDTVEGLQFILRNDKVTAQGTVYIDEICLLDLTDYEQSLVGDLNGDQIANFDDSRYYFLASKGENFWFNTNYNASYKVITSGVEGANGGVLSVHASSSAPIAIKFKFPEAITLSENAYFKIRVKTTGTKDSVRIGNYGLGVLHEDGWNSTNAIGVGLADYGFTASGWETIYVPACVALELNVGETAEGLQFILQSDGFESKTLYIDEISFVNMTQKMEALENALTGNQVATYDSSDYAFLIKTQSASATIKDGLLTISNIATYNWQKLSFAKAQTVADGDYLVIKMKTTYRTRIRGEKNPSSVGYDFFNNSNPNWENYDSRFSYIVKDQMQVVSIPVSKLGYDVGDTMTSFSLGYWHENGEVLGTFVIDYIEYVKATDGVITDFTEAGNAYHARPDADVKWGTNDYGDYHYYDCDYTEYDQTENAVKIKSITENLGSSIRLYFARPVVVTVNTRISVSLKYVPSQAYADQTWCISLGTDAGLLSNLISASNYGNGYIHGQDSVITFSPYTLLGAQIGSEVNYIDIVFKGGGELFVKKITTEELNVKTLVIGDSYSSRDYWKNCETQLSSVGGHTIGVPGAEIGDWIARIDEIKAYNPENIVIHLGVNDINRGQSGESSAEELETLIESLKTALPNAKIFYVNISNNKNYEQKWEEYAVHNAAVKTYIDSAENVYLVDFASAQVANENVWANGGYIVNDSTHLTQEAYETFAEMVLQAIQSANA